MNKLEVKNKLKDNKLPEGWAKVKLDSLLIESKERNITNKKLLVFSITNVKGFVLQDEYFSHNIHSEKTTNYKIFRENYFGYNPARINVGSIALSEKQREGLLSPMYVIFKTKSTLNPKYLKYFIQTSHFKNNVINNVAGSVRESLNYSSLEMFDFMYPISISEQNRIAEILETVDETIEKTDTIIEKYKRIKHGLMQDLLSRGIDENGKIRSEETHKFKDSPLGRIPEKWEIVKVKDIGEIEGGYAFKSDSFLLNGEYQVIKIGNLYKGILDLKKNLAYLNTLNEQEEKYTLKHLEILITLTGTIGKKDYGYTVILKHPKKVIFNQRVARIRVINTQNNPIFIFYQTKMEFFLNQFFDNSKGGTGNQTNVSVYDLKKIKIIRPSLPEQQRIASILSSIDETIEKEQKYKEKLERIKQGLMEDLLTGKMRVLNVN